MSRSKAGAGRTDFSIDVHRVLSVPRWNQICAAQLVGFGLLRLAGFGLFCAAPLPQIFPAPPHGLPVVTAAIRNGTL